MDVKTIRSEFPHLVFYFADEKYVDYSIKTKKAVAVICPCCKKKHDVPIRTIALRGNTCCSKCNDNYSYPERFMATILDAIGVDYIPQYTSSWTKKYRYDFYFLLGDKHFIIEMDGGIGHGHNKGNKTPTESLSIDNEKDALAEQNGCIVIRIDCDYGNRNRFVSIKNSIINSEISSVFDLSVVNWDDCNKIASSSRTMNIIDLYKNTTPFVEEIAQMLHVSKSTVKVTLLQARQNGLIDNQPIHTKNPLRGCPVKVVMNSQYIIKKACPVYCYEDAIAFGSTFDADEYYGYPKYTVRNSLNSYAGSHKGKHFVKYAELPKGFDFLPKFFSDDEYRYHAYCQWTLDNSLVNIYESKKDIPSCYKYLAIQRVNNGTFKTAYGYKWSILPKELEYKWLATSIDERPKLMKIIENMLNEKRCV